MLAPGTVLPDCGAGPDDVAGLLARSREARPLQWVRGDFGGAGTE